MSTISQLKIENTIYNIKDANAARTDHSHSANDISSGTIPISRGGTGATTAAAARTALNVSPIDGLYYAVEATATSAHQYTPQTLIYVKSLEKLYRANSMISPGDDIPSQSDSVTLTTEIIDCKTNVSQVSPSAAWQNYSVGEYVRVGNYLRRVTSAISQGNTINNSNSVVVKVMDELADAKIAAKNASNITSGTLSADRVPALAASKITSGTFSADRIPSLAASKITSGTFGVDRIPALAASKITSGTFSVDRIPTLPVSKITGAISTSGGTISDGALILSDQNLAIKSTNVNRDASNPSSAADAKNLVFMDNDNDFIGYINVVRETDGRIGLKLAAVNEKTDGSTVYNTLKLYVNRAGTTSYEVTNPGAFCNAISAARKNWTQKASLYGNVNGILSYDLTGCSEVMFVAYYGSVYCGSAILPIDILSTSTQREIYLGGGYSNGSNGRNFAIKATLTQGVITSAAVDGVSQTAMWAVYGR